MSHDHHHHMRQAHVSGIFHGYAIFPDRFVERGMLAVALILSCTLIAVFSKAPVPTCPVSSIETKWRRLGKDAFLDELVSQMTIPELVMQLHLMSADNIVGPKSDNGFYDFGTRFAPGAGVGVVHDWYPTNASQFNSLQELQLSKSVLKIPFMQTGECLHGVGSFKQSIFPQSIGLSASFDTELVGRVGRAIGTEARSIGIHACFSPVLDLGKDPRWGRVQEAWGEDFVLTSHMGVAYASGLSKNGSWADEDAVVPVMKHFAAHGSPRGGLNTAPFMGRGMREVKQEMLIPFRDVVQRAGVRGVMMAYSELDEIPCSVHPVLYDALDEWGYDGFVMADDTGMRELYTGHRVSNSTADTIQQWFNAGGMLQFYDYPLDVYLNTTEALVSNYTVPLSTLRSHARRILSVKYDLGLFTNPYIPSSISSSNITKANLPLTLEAAQKSIVLLENRNSTLPIRPALQGISKIALVGPFVDLYNYGDYSGTWGAGPAENATTIRQAVDSYLKVNASNVQLVSSWGSNTWLYNAQYPIPGYLLSPPESNETGGLRATYYADTDFKTPIFQTVEIPNRDWGLYPPNGLPSNNFSVVWEGQLQVPVDSDVDGYIGVAVYANDTAKLYVDDVLVAHAQLTTEGNIMSNIEPLSYAILNGTMPPPGGSEFKFVKGHTHQIKIEFQAWNLAQKFENINSVNAQVELFWNLVDRENPVGKAVEIAQDADLIVLAVGAGWNSDAENADRASLGLSANQTELVDAIFGLNKPVVIVLQGGRPFAIPTYYDKAAAVLNGFFPGQSGGQAIADVLFGLFNPGGRIPLSVPSDAAILPVYYNYKPTAHLLAYTDVPPYPVYSFGYGLSYSSWSTKRFGATSSTFSAGSNITFEVTVTNEGPLPGSYVAQVYLLGRVSTITRAERQLMAFQRVYLDAGESRQLFMELEVDRFLPILNRKYEWILETGPYTFALLEHGGDATTDVTRDSSRPFYFFEFFPPRTDRGFQNLLPRIGRLAKLDPVAISVTWGAGGSTKDRSLDIAGMTQAEYGLDTILHLTCTNMMQGMVDMALNHAKDRGIQNILALRGDPPRGKEEWLPVDPRFQHGIDLVTYVRSTPQFSDYFCIGVAGYPEGHPDSMATEDEELERLKQKVDAGADFIITQLFYDVEQFLHWVRKVREKGITVPIVPGVMPIQTYASFQRMVRLVGARLPASITEELDRVKHDDQLVKEYGIKLAVEVIERITLEGGITGVHFCTLNLEKSVQRVLEELHWTGALPPAHNRLITETDQSTQSLLIKPSIATSTAKEGLANIPSIQAEVGSGELNNAASWDDFPNGRFGDFKSPAFGVGEHGQWGTVGISGKGSSLSQYGDPPGSYEELTRIFLDYLNGKVPTTPFSPGPLSTESLMILSSLEKLTKKGWWTVASQPAVDAAPSSDEAVGWGPRAGYVFQKPFVEFFCEESDVDLIEKRVVRNGKGQVHFFASSAKGGKGGGECRTNVPEDGRNAVTWGIFPGQEVIQTTIIEKESFLSWKDEAFSIWSEWASFYAPGSPERETLDTVRNERWLISIVHHDYKNKDALWNFLFLDN